MDPSVPWRTLRRERVEPAEAVRARRWPDVPRPPDPEELLYHKQDDDEQLRVEPRVVLPSELPWRAPDVHQQSSLGATAKVGLGVSPPAQQDKLEILTDALAHLARKGLTAAAVIANFHWQRLIPLMERKLPIFDLTPEASYEGSRTSNVLLPP